MVRPRPRRLRRRRPASQARLLHSMDFIWSPWRYDSLASRDKKRLSCVVSIGDGRSRDAEKLGVFRGIHNFITLNLFPYTSGHTMVAPYQHLEAITEARPEQLSDMMELAQRFIR